MIKKVGQSANGLSKSNRRRQEVKKDEKRTFFNFCVQEKSCQASNNSAIDSKASLPKSGNSLGVLGVVIPLMKNMVEAGSQNASRNKD